MPVVEKIEILGSQTFYDIGITEYSRFKIEHNNIKLHYKNHGYQLFLEVIPKHKGNSSYGIFVKEYIELILIKNSSKIEAMWLAVINFISRYNTQNK